MTLAYRGDTAMTCGDWSEQRDAGSVIGCEMCAVILVEVVSDENYDRLADLCVDYHEKDQRLRQEHLELPGPGLLSALERIADENFTLVLGWCHDDPSFLPTLDKQPVWPPELLNGIVTTVRERGLDMATTRALLRFAYVIDYDDTHPDGHPDWQRVLTGLTEMSGEQIHRCGDLAQELLEYEWYLTVRTTPLEWMRQVRAGTPLEQIRAEAGEHYAKMIEAEPQVEA